jgi:hypothetical protein
VGKYHPFTTETSEPEYAEQTVYDAESVAPLVIDGKEIAHLAVKDLLA